MKKITIWLFIIIGLCFSQQAFSAEKINDLNIKSRIGLSEVPIVHVDVAIEKARDLHVTIQSFDGWKKVAGTKKRIKSSGKYHFEMPIENMQPGRYRAISYITPKGKNWDKRIGEEVRVVFEVLAQQFTKEPVAEPKASIVDKIKAISFPKKVTGNEAVDLSIKFDIAKSRKIKIRLLNSENWKELGVLKYTVNESGVLDIPLVNLADDFPAGKYAWVVFLLDSSTEKEVAKKMGKHFELFSK